MEADDAEAQMGRIFFCLLSLESRPPFHQMIASIKKPFHHMEEICNIYDLVLFMEAMETNF